MEEELYQYLKQNGGGITIQGSQVCPTLVSRITAAVGNTQDDLVVICLVDDNNETNNS